MGRKRVDPGSTLPDRPSSEQDMADPEIVRWVGIDEAGYGPNLGPLVMTAIVAEGPADRPPDLWADLAATVARAGAKDDRLWVDDSKAVYSGGQGLHRLEAASLAALAASGRALPGSFCGLLDALGAGTAEDVEARLWLEEGEDPPLPRADTRHRLEQVVARRPLEGAPWRIVSAHSVVVGPARFNRGLGRTGSKARVHFEAFASLLAGLWDSSPEGADLRVRSDKHGGRNYYYAPLVDAFPDFWIDRGPEGPDLSRYTLRGSGKRLELSVQPRADAEDGLVALASIVSKTVREHWMGAFNAHWAARIPDLKPTAGYPADAARFRRAIEPACRERGLDLEHWWRVK
jgi:hypothetical protein